MRSVKSAVMSLAIGIATPTLVPALTQADEKSVAQVQMAQAHMVYQPTFDDCFRLAWVRGVHVELGELPEFNELCRAGKVPFETGNPADSIRLNTR